MSLSSLELLAQKSMEFKNEKQPTGPLKNEDENFKLSYAFQNLSELDPQVLPKGVETIRILDLTENNFTGASDLRFLFSFSHLKTLILDKNLIQSNVKFPYMPTLETLWVNHNKIENLAIFVENLVQSCPNLVYLSMINNKAAPSYFNGGSLAEYNDYRQFVICKLPNLKMLDSKEITTEERAQAKSVYGGVRLAKTGESGTKSRRRSTLKNTETPKKDKIEKQVSREKPTSLSNQNERISRTKSQSPTIENNKEFDPTPLILPDVDEATSSKIQENSSTDMDDLLEKLPNVEELPDLSNSRPPSITIDYESLPEINDQPGSTHLT